MGAVGLSRPGEHKPALVTGTRLASPLPDSRRSVIAFVWGEDENQAEIAEDVLAHALWPCWYQYQVAAVRRLKSAGSCPLRREAPEVLASIWRTQWAWVLVAPETDIATIARMSDE